MSISFKDEDLSSIDGILKACDKLTLKEDETARHLQTLLSRQCHLETKLRGIARALPSLQAVQGDAQQLAQMITNTSTLAEGVSAKVRKLDDARSRVSECQRRVLDLLDLQLCSEGVQRALREEDYEQGAAHVHRYLSMDHTLLRRTADDVNEDCEALTNSLSLLQKAAQLLRTEVTVRFDEAVNSGDHASVERFFKMFPLLDLQDEGLRKFSAFLCSKLQKTSEKNLRTALETRASDKRATVVFADALTLLFEDIARIIEIHHPLIETYYGPGRLLSVVQAIQNECDKQSQRILHEFHRHRQLDFALTSAAEWLRPGQTQATAPTSPDPKELDVLLGELTIMHARTELYLRFLRRRVVSDSEASDGDHTEALSQLEKLLRNCDLSVAVQGLLSNYLQLENYFMAASIRKAVGMDQLEHGTGPQTTSMVDDVFFIVRKCIRRAIASSSLDGVCAVLNFACTHLESDYSGTLRAQLRQGYPSGYLDLTHAYNALHTSIQHGRLQSSDSERARLTFLAYLNDADLSVEYISTLRRTISDELTHALPSLSDGERVKLETCLGGLSGVGASLRALAEYGMGQLAASAVRPRVGPWVDAFLVHNHSPNEEEIVQYESNESFVQGLITHLDSLLESFKPNLTTSNYDALVSILAAEVAQQMEKVIGKTLFNRLGGLVLDREVRVLVSYLTNATSWSIREKLSRLVQVATVLNLEKPAEIADYWGNEAGTITWRLTSSEVRHFMSLRTDFRSEDVKRLKL